MEFAFLKMHFKAFRWIVLSISLTVAVQSAASQGKSFCLPRANEHPLVKGRSKIIEFPDGRVITVVGHMHGHRQIFQIFKLIDNGRLETMSDKELNDILIKIAEENREIYEGMTTRQGRMSFIRKFKTMGVDLSNIVSMQNSFDLENMSVELHARQDEEFLKDAISQPQNRIRFVGYEGSQETWSGNMPYNLRTRLALLHQFDLRQGRGKLTFSRTQIEDLIRSASNGHVYVYMQNPDLVKTISMVGTESPEIASRSSELRPLAKTNAAWQEVLAADEAYWEKKPEADRKKFRSVSANYAFGASLMHVYSKVMTMNYSSAAELESSINMLRDQSPFWLKPSLEQLFRALRQRVRINMERDAASAQNLARRFESGIHFVGLNHFNTTISNLETLCRAELAASSDALIAAPPGTAQ